VEQWLERTPFINLGEFDFWAHYTSSINAVMAQERHFVDQQSSLTQDQRAELHAEIDGREEHYESVVDEDKYEAKRANGDVRMSFKATKAALLISLYQVGGCCAGASVRCAAAVFLHPWHTTRRNHHRRNHATTASPASPARRPRTSR
jgi:hypothetical protein